jgi:hypothetical protein
MPEGTKGPANKSHGRKKYYTEDQNLAIRDLNVWSAVRVMENKSNDYRSRENS